MEKIICLHSHFEVNKKKSDHYHLEMEKNSNYLLAVIVECITLLLGCRRYFVLVSKVSFPGYRSRTLVIFVVECFWCGSAGALSRIFPLGLVQFFILFVHVMKWFNFSCWLIAWFRLELFLSIQLNAGRSKLKVYIFFEM